MAQRILNTNNNTFSYEGAAISVITKLASQGVSFPQGYVLQQGFQLGNNTIYQGDSIVVNNQDAQAGYNVRLTQIGNTPDVFDKLVIQVERGDIPFKGVFYKDGELVRSNGEVVVINILDHTILNELLKGTHWTKGYNCTDSEWLNL